MTAVVVIEDLIKLGTIIIDAASKKTGKGKFDFNGFMMSNAPRDIQDAVKAIMAELKPSKIQDAINDVEKKQRDLLAGRPISLLSTDKLVQYAALTDTKLLLSAALVKMTSEEDLFGWLMSGGLGDIAKIVTVVIPLLV